MRARRIIAVLAAGACGLLLVAIVRPTTFWSPDGGDIARSLEDAGPFVTYDDCTRQGEHLWRCGIEDDPGSGESGAYMVRLQSDDCWTAERGKRRLGGCVGFGDYVFTWDLF